MTPTEVLFSLGETPLSLPVVVAAGFARAADLGGLGLGDVVVVSGFRGVALVAPDAASGVRVTQLDGKVRIEAERAELGELAAGSRPADGSRSMSDDGATLQLSALEESAHLAEHLAELPLAVRIEVGSATLPAREWAALAVGDVLVARPAGGRSGHAPHRGQSDGTRGARRGRWGAGRAASRSERCEAPAAGSGRTVYRGVREGKTSPRTRASPLRPRLGVRRLPSRRRLRPPKGAPMELAGSYSAKQATVRTPEDAPPFIHPESKDGVATGSSP